MAFWLSSEIDKDKTLKKLAKEATKNEDVQREMDSLVKQLHAGNLSAGLGIKSLSGTNIFYLRGRNGSRLYLRKEGEIYVIIAKSSKGKNQEKVLRHLQKIHA